MVGASVWAHPPRYMMQLKDTMNAMFNRMEIYRNLPFFMDEVTNMTPEEVSDCAYQVSQGYQKARMESGNNRERGRGEQWALLNICSANASLLDKLATYKETPQGEAARLLEYHTHKVVFEGKQETDKFSEQINKNTGWAGPIFIRYVMKHRDKVQELLKKIQDNIDKAQNLEAANRYYSYACACALTSLTITNQLGLTKYDLKSLRKWIIYDLLRTNLETLKTTEMDVLKVINDFIHDHHGAFLRIGSGEVDDNSLDNPGMESLLVPDKAPSHRMVGRYETDTYKLYILPSALRKWCALRQIHYKQLEDQLRSDLKATIEPTQLNRGLGFRTGTVNTLAMKLDVGDVESL
jgi:mRNA-degrading endonuclease RelE of RelBE toxin-antitoxin system